MSRVFLQKSRHKTVFYFRRKIPLDLRERLRVTQIYRSLHTSDRQQAIVLARRLATWSDEFFNAARHMSKEDFDKSPLARLLAERKLIGSYKDQIEELKEQLLDIHADKSKEVAGLKAENSAIKSDHLEQMKQLLGARVAVPTPSPSFTTMTVREAVTGLLASDDIKPRSKKRYRSIYDHFADFIGWDTQLHEVSNKLFAEYADSVSMDSSKAVATKRNYITIAARLFNWAHIRDDRIPEMGAKGLKPKRKTPAHLDRAAHSLDELASIFQNVSDYRDSQPHRFWATVLPAFLGCRIEELAQADIANDFKKHPGSSIWYLDVAENNVSANDGGKSVKKLSSWRYVPIHSALIRHGFIDFLNAEKAQGAATLFERHWKPHRDPETGAVIRAHGIVKWGSRQLNRLRRTGILTTPGTSYFHSMRHTISTHLAKKGIAPEWRAAICGQETTGGGVNEEIYTKLRNDVSALSKVLEESMSEYVAMLDKCA